MPRVRLVPLVRVSHNPFHDLETVAVESTALVDETPSAAIDARATDYQISGAGDRASDSRVREDSATTVFERPGRLEVAIHSGIEQLLVVAESHHPGWRATVDGRARAVLRVNGDFLGCVVGPEDRDVVLEFRPQSLFWGRILSCLGLLVVGVLPLVPSFARERGCIPNRFSARSF